jgi:hypothetical protein
MWGMMLYHPLTRSQAPQFLQRVCRPQNTPLRMHVVSSRSRTRRLVAACNQMQLGPGAGVH